MTRCWLALAVALTLPGRSALAGDPAVNVGLVEVVTPSAQHVAAYPYVAFSLSLPAANVFLVPTLGVGWSPELGAWGFTASFVVDVPVRDGLGIDVIASAVHDQPAGSWSDAAFYAGGGLGLSWTREAWTISPSFSVITGINVDGWTLAPALNLGHAF